MGGKKPPRTKLSAGAEVQLESGIVLKSKNVWKTNKKIKYIQF